MNLAPFERVVDEHGPTVLRVCRAVLADADAEDAAAETFLAALAAYPTLRPGSDVRAWLVTIAHRKAIDSIRAASRRPVPTGTPGTDGAARFGAPPEPYDEALWAAVRALPDKQRRSVAYHYLADLPYAAVGELLGTSEAAARRAAADGIAALRRSTGAFCDRADTFDSGERVAQAARLQTGGA